MRILNKTRLALAAFAFAALSTAANANYDEPDKAPDPSNSAADVKATNLKIDEHDNFMVIEFNPLTIPGKRCVFSVYGTASGMQCFDRPKTAPAQ